MGSQPYSYYHMKSLSVLIPFYNEERTITKLVEELSQLPVGLVTICIFVNDGSSDNSLNLLETALKKVKLSNVVISKPNGGKASAIKEASTKIETTHAIILDADLELNTFDILRMWQVVLDEKSEFVFGYRSFLAQSAFTYRYARGNQFLSHLYGVLFNEVITDIMCGYKLLPTQYFKNLPFNYSQFAIEVEIPLYLWLQRIRPHEILVDYTPRSRDQGKIIGIRDALQIIFDLVLFRIRRAKQRVK